MNGSIDVGPAQQESLRELYRCRYAVALKLARSYDGTETMYQHFTTYLAELERWLQEIVHGDVRKAITAKKSREIANEIIGRHSVYAVEDLIEVAIARVRRLGQRTRQGIFSMQLDGVLLPTEKRPTPPKSSNQYESFGGSEHDRLGEVIAFLIRDGVYVDDLVLCVGGIGPNMIRRHSYVLVEIPRLNRQILICNEKGEATFVIRGIFRRETLLTSSKDDLLAAYPQAVVKIVYVNSDQWLAAMHTALFFEDAAGQTNLEPKFVGGKINLCEREDVIAQVRATHTSANWMRLVWQVGDVIPNYSKTRLARVFQLDIDPRTRVGFMFLGRAIYGEDDPEMKKAHASLSDAEKLEVMNPDAIRSLREEIKLKIPSGKEWMARGVKSRGAIVRNYAPQHLSTIFRTGGNPNDKCKDYVVLGLAIFGSDDIFLTDKLKEIQRDERLESGDEDELNKLRAEIKLAFVDGKAWLEMKQRSGDIVPGYKITRLARFFGTTGNVCGEWKAFVETGASIFGPEDQSLQAELKAISVKERAYLGNVDALDVFKVQIRQKITDGAGWLKLFGKRGDVIPGFAVVKLATLFQVEGNPLSVKKSFILLGRKIYGDDEPILKEKWEELVFDEQLDAGDVSARLELIRAIKASRASADIWMDNFTKRGKFAKHYGLVRLAQIFGIIGNPNAHKKSYIHLGMAIYGEENVRLKNELTALP